MTDLSANEAELLYAIKNDQGRTLTYYGDELRKHYTQLTRALEHLKHAGYVRATENNRLYISDEFKQRQQAEPEPESVEETVVELAAVVDVPEAQPVLKTEPETTPVHEAGMKTTPEMIAAYMADGVERTAAVIAQQFGHAKGTTLINPLRKLVTDGLLVKTGTVYSLPVVERNVDPVAVAEVLEQTADFVAEIKSETVAEESDDDLAARLIAVLEKDKPAVEPEPVVEIPAVEDGYKEEIQRGNLPTLFSGELQNHILKKRNAFTATEVMLDFAESHYIDKDRFMEIFEDVALSGDLLCFDGAEFIDPTLEYVPGSQYIVLRKTEPTDAIAIMDEYCENIREPYKLFDIVETTHIHHADVLRYLVDFDYDVTDHERIVKGPHTSNVQYAQKTAVSASPKAGTFPPKNTYPVRTTPNFGNKEYKPFRPKSDRDVPLISYAMIENLKPTDITDFLDGGVKVSVFIRKFNLHPDDEKHIVEVLTLTGVAELTSVEGVDWLFLKNRASVQLSQQDIGSLTAPTGEPARKWTPVEKENLRDALKIVAQEENRVTTAKDLDPSLPDVVPSGDISLLMKDALDLIVDSEEEKLEKIGVLRDAILDAGMAPQTVFMSRELADEMGVPITECTCTQRTYGNELHEDSCAVAELENDLLGKPVEGIKGPAGPTPEEVAYRKNRLLSPGISVNEGKETFEGFPPDPQWLLTLKMLEERLRFEHQSTTADQLHEIRKYLEP